MNQLPLSQWIEITATSRMPLYAILSNVGSSQAVKEYYLHDGRNTPVGLYSNTPYDAWVSVAPMIVPLEENSPFLNWVENTEHHDWGWLARSPYPFERIIAHFRGLVQVILPDETVVFFRYWDGCWLSEHLRYMGDGWRDVMPPFAFYRVNGESFCVHISADAEPKISPWWNVPQGVIDFMMQKDSAPLVTSAMKYLKEQRPDIFNIHDETVLKARLHRRLRVTGNPPDMSTLIQYIESEMQCDLD